MPGQTECSESKPLVLQEHVMAWRLPLNKWTHTEGV